VASAEPTVGDFSTFQQVSSHRVSRFLTEFEYHVPLTADLQDLSGAIVTVTSLSAVTTIVDGSLSFGSISAGATRFSTDTFSFRHDRRVPFDPSVLQFTIDTLPGNRPPVANAGTDQTVSVNDSVILDGSGSSDVDGDLLSFSWSFVLRPPGSAAVLANPKDVESGFDVDIPGTYVVQLIVNDGTVDSAPDTVVIDTGNSTPVADAGPDQTVFVTDTVRLDGSGSSDADGDLLTFQWSFSTRPAGSTASLSNPQAVGPTFVVDLPGTYILQLVVDDGSVESAPDSVRIDTENSPPIADPGPNQSGSLAETVELDGSGSSDVVHVPPGRQRRGPR
jgi:hypothetical protein